MEATCILGGQTCGSVFTILKVAFYQLADMSSWCSYVAETEVEEFINSFCAHIASTASFHCWAPGEWNLHYVGISMLCKKTRYVWFVEVTE